MRKLLFFILGLPALSFGQWTENFDAGTTMPAGWAVINNGGANGWVFGTPGTGTAQSGTNVASLTYNATAHDDYLITKAITVTAGVSDRISFYVKSRSASFLENYEVLLSTTDQTAGAFTTVLQASQDAPTAWTQNTFDLSAYVGQTVYVAIHATDTDQWQLYADTFVVDSVPTTPPSCTTITSPTNGATGVNPDGILNWTMIPAATGYKVRVGTTPGGTDIVNNTDAGNVLTYNITGNLNTNTLYYATIIPYNGIGDATGCSEISFTTVAAPANDDCAGAVSLTVNSDLACGTVTAGNTLGASASADVLAPCTGTADDDVWYSFTATGTTHQISLTNLVSTGTTTASSIYFQVLSGACGALTNVNCSTTATKTITGLTAGQTYYVRVYTSSGAGYNMSFNICVGTPPPPPANDNCASPIALTVGTDFASGAITTTNVSATSDGTPESCQTSSNNNVWYSVVVPSSGMLTIETKAATGSAYTDSVINVFSGSCGALTGVGCDDDNGDGNFSLLSLTGQTPGTVLLISVWRWSNASVFDGEFQLSAYDSSTLATTEVSKTKNSIQAFPNPFSEVLNISDISNVKSISVMDVAGRLVKTIEKPSSTLHLGELRSGMYMVTLTMKDGTMQTIKTIKK
ncbi:hypothetical protein HNP38_000274 [Chryseobacterium defluvii]|uniref:Secreted protein (Por secretion system target) n=1 Tax=Chryseobacterium defluvii TaxID=160396 RepID=A0A840KDF2_9FLAO|nr:choice-of-anchor J domain-containing protein [Chryseobacterium defluvii]MBB4805002.1 hypothetical protein [Chryseobacterium defluvii]